MQPVTGAPSGPVEAVEHTDGQLGTAQIADQFGAVVSVQAGTAIRAHAELNSGAPADRRSGTHRFGLPVPLMIAKAGELIGHHCTLDHPGRLRVGEGEIAASGPVHARNRA